MTLLDLGAAIDASRRSQGRRFAATPWSRTKALALTAGARKRTEQVVVTLSPAAHAELAKRAAALNVVASGLGAYLLEMALHKLFPAPRRSRPNPVVTCACGCGAMFEQMDEDSRPRRFVVGHNRRRVRAVER